MRRRLLALVAALILGGTTYFTLHHLYASGHLTIDFSDGQGHGPDHGGLEWQGAVRSAIPFHSALGAATAGAAAFAVVFWCLRPSHDDQFA